MTFRTSLVFGSALALLAILNLVPLFVHVRQVPLSAVEGHKAFIWEPWAAGITLVALLHVVYLIYFLQWGDISSNRATAIFLLSVATGYAVVLGVRLLARPGNPVINWLALDANQFSSQQETLWCFLMMTLSGGLSYLVGRAHRLLSF